MNTLKLLSLHSVCQIAVYIHNTIHLYARLHPLDQTRVKARLESNCTSTGKKSSARSESRPVAGRRNYRHVSPEVSTMSYTYINTLHVYCVIQSFGDRCVHGIFREMDNINRLDAFKQIIFALLLLFSSISLCFSTNSYTISFSRGVYIA